MTRRSTSDYTLDVGCCSAVAVCRRCEHRIVRGDAERARLEMLRHVRTAHRDIPRALMRAERELLRAGA